MTSLADRIPRASEPNHGWVVHPEFLYSLVCAIKEQSQEDVPSMEAAEFVILRLVDLGYAHLTSPASNGADRGAP